MGKSIMSLETKPWFLLQFHPNSHRVAERNLGRQGFEIFLPVHEITRRVSSRFVSNVRPLFPGYLFITFNIDDEPWRKINNTVGVSRLVSFGGRPKLVPYELINRLMYRCDRFGKLLPHKTFSEGELVHLALGPFANFVGTIEEIEEDKRIWVLMDFMGQSARVAVDPEKLQTKR